MPSTGFESRHSHQGVCMDLYTKGQMQNAWFIGWLMGITAGLCVSWIVNHPEDVDNLYRLFLNAG